MIVVVDTGLGNLRSILRGLQRAGGRAVASADPRDVEKAERIVIPGVGSFGDAMAKLTSDGLDDVLERKALGERVPTLGICLGMQLLGDWSDEGGCAGLGWVRGRTARLRPADPPLPVPHLGWNTVALERESALFQGVPAGACFFFAHSYGVSCDDATDAVGRTEYGVPFVSVLQRGNVFGTQFHPEKSHSNGLRVLRNFLAWC